MPLKEDGTPDIDALNREFSKEYLAEQGNPRWIAKPTVGLPLGADGEVQELPGDDTAPQDSLALQEG